jgi:ketosteroid isomerase-like protein
MSKSRAERHLIAATVRRPRRRRLPTRNPLAVTRAFVRHVNAHNVSELCRLMTPQHRFVDPTGAVHVGRNVMREGWSRYFEMFPDYRIRIEFALASRSRVALFGSTSATYAPNGSSVSMHAAWLAVVRGARLSEWRVYADNGPARAVIRG